QKLEMVANRSRIRALPVGIFHLADLKTEIPQNIRECNIRWNIKILRCFKHGQGIEKFVIDTVCIRCGKKKNIAMLFQCPESLFNIPKRVRQMLDGPP